MHSPRIFKNIIAQVNPNADMAKIERARAFAERVHEKQRRATGEPYITHPLMVTQYLLQQGIGDTVSICSCLLHDCIEDGDISTKDIEREFGSEIASVVEGLTKVDRSEKLENYDAVNLRKIVLASAKDARVIIIKLCDILHNLNTIQGLSEDKRRRYASIALHVYAPIAEKIGLYRLKGEIEDRCLEILHPFIYEYLSSRIRLTREEREASTDTLINDLGNLFESHNVDVRIIGRTKYLYSIYQKMHKHNKTLEQIYDYYGIRIIAKTEEDCYRVHKILSEVWDTVPKRFKDFIKKPKLNGYQSLHDNYIVDGKVVEVQIRTEEMNNGAEFGPSIHWKYKRTERDKKFDKKINHMKQIIAWKEEVRESADADRFVIDAFKDQIVVITPKGDPVILKEKSTALDFAFELHSSVGLHAKIAVVNGEHKTLFTELKSGDIVEIITGKELTAHPGWLQHVVTKQARGKIRGALAMEQSKAHTQSVQSRKRDEVHVLRDLEIHGVKLPIQFAKCCSPQSGDDVVAYYTKDKKKITVHKKNCSNRFMINQRQQVHVNWHRPDAQYSITISCEDTPGILIKVLDILSNTGIGVQSVQSKTTKNSLILSIQCKEKLSEDKRQTIVNALHDLSSFISIES